MIIYLRARRRNHYFRAVRQMSSPPFLAFSARPLLRDCAPVRLGNGGGPNGRTERGVDYTAETPRRLFRSYLHRNKNNNLILFIIITRLDYIISTYYNSTMSGRNGQKKKPHTITAQK